jgi:hypothetical protein
MELAKKLKYIPDLRYKLEIKGLLSSPFFTIKMEEKEKEII